MIRTVVLDIGETLTRDDRYWAAWADWLGVSRHTLSALVGAVVVDGRDNADAIRLLRPDVDIDAEYAARDAAGLGERLDETDLYEDVRPALTTLRAAGVRVIVAGNQSPRAGHLLRMLSLPADLVVTSGEWGVSKPARGFFEQVLAVSGSSAPETLYVGDHPANDIYPARAAGLRTAHLRRGPWGNWWADDPEVRAAADWSINSLTELADIVKP
ncbi:HAD family hydrolase [Streptomyces sp. NPDC003042]